MLNSLEGITESCPTQRYLPNYNGEDSATGIAPTWPLSPAADQLPSLSKQIKTLCDV